MTSNQSQPTTMASPPSLPLGFLNRLNLALNLFWRTLTEQPVADALAWLRWHEVEEGQRLKQDGSDFAKATATPLREASPDAGFQILGLLQQEGRFVDFIQEDMGSFSDAEIGAAARVVHEGCRKALKEHLSLEPVRSEEEGSRITLESGFDAQAIRLTGNVVGEPPFKGTLAHRGWRATALTLPKVTESHDLKVIAPAEVEL